MPGRRSTAASARAMFGALREGCVYLLELAGEDDRFARGEATVAAAGLRQLAPGIAGATAVDVDRARGLAFTRSISRRLATAKGASIEAVRAAASIPFDRSGTAAVRARDVRGRAGVDTPAVERDVGSVLVDAGFEIDLEAPDHVLRVLAVSADGRVHWYLGWEVVAPERGFGSRRPPERPFRQPGTLQPQLARALVNLSGIDPGERFLDPMCGPGAMLVEAGLLEAQPLGIDHQARMVRGAIDNYRALGPETPAVEAIQASAHALPVHRADAAAFDAPYGRQSPIGHGTASELVAAALAELRSVVPRVVAVFDRPIDAIAADAGWRPVDRFERPVHRSLTRYITVLDRSST